MEICSVILGEEGINGHVFLLLLLLVTSVFRCKLGVVDVGRNLGSLHRSFIGGGGFSGRT